MSHPTLPTLQQNLYEAFQDIDKPDNGHSPLSDLYLFKQTRLNTPADTRQTANAVLTTLLNTLAQDYPNMANILTRHFLEGEKVVFIAQALHIGEATFYRRQNEALAQLARILQTQELESQSRRQNKLLARLEPPTCTKLIGIDAPLETLHNLLCRPADPQLVMITGIGGIGKTSLADTLTRRIIAGHYFDDVAWISARQYIFNTGGSIDSTPRSPALTAEHLVEQLLSQLLPTLPGSATLSATQAWQQLQHRLKQQPHLIVVDNLETAQDIDQLLPLLQELVKPSKVLLTSRKNLYQHSSLYHFPLPELNQADTLRLIRYQINIQNLHHLRPAPDNTLVDIYNIVGGNPLAVKLVLGQTHIFSLPDILSDLTAARGESTETLYTYIYRRAWDVLNEPTRCLLLTMPLITDEGETLTDLTELSGLTPTESRSALQRLVELNLVNISGDYRQRRYSIHNLTRAFLQEQVLKWQ